MSTSRSYHHGALPEAVLGAARDLLEEQPVDRLSVRELARRAGVSAAAPYRHFGDREGLRAALAERCFSEFVRDQERAYAAVEPDGRLLAVGEAYVAYALAHPHAFGLVYDATLERGSPTEGVAQLVRRHADLLADAVRDAAAHEQVPVDADPVDVGTALWSLAHGLATLAARGYVDRTRVRPVLAALLRLPGRSTHDDAPPPERGRGVGAPAQLL